MDGQLMSVDGLTPSPLWRSAHDLGPRPGPVPRRRLNVITSVRLPPPSRGDREGRRRGRPLVPSVGWLAGLRVVRSRDDGEISYWM
jgi:hypothetical protein